MTADDWKRVRDLFEAALDVEPAARTAWLHAQPAPADVRAEAESLLDNHARAGGFLEAPAAVDAADVQDAALAPGAVIGHYRIVREIGRGAMGRVYAADDLTLGRTVALKALPPHLTDDPSYRERLRREARAAAGLTHPGISIVYALEEFDGHLFIASELIDGHTLRDEISSHTAQSSGAIAATARELAEALAAAHASGITHRDFKPENVMRDRAGRLKVLDFGVASTAAAGPAAAGVLTTLPGVLIGTPAYMAPEQLNGHKVDARADVFAYGVVLYEYASGVHPFDASTPLGLVARVLESHAQPIADRAPAVPAQVGMVIDRCLRKSPDERFASAGEIVAALAAGADGVLPVRSAGSGVWWRAHQVVVMAVYAGAAVLAWAIKEAFRGPLTLWVFVAVGVGASVGGVARGHLLFTSGFNPVRLKEEHVRIRRALLAVDLMVAAVLGTDGLSIAAAAPLWGVLTLGLAMGIALATLLIEPATVEAFLK